MTHTTPEQLMHELRDIRLSDAQRLELRARLKGYVAMHPVRAPLWALLTRHALVTACAMVVLLAGTTIATAHYAKPDSLFYPIRVVFNERIAVAISGDELTQLDTELKQLERSIDEERSLADHDLSFDDSDDQEDAALETELNALERELNDATEDLPSED